MGLDVSYGAFNGPYSAFMRWRKAVAQAAGGDMKPTEPGVAWFTYEETAFEYVDQELGFRELMGHSDCDGEIPPALLPHVADALEHLLPNIREDMPGVRKLSMKEATEKFIAGCREAYAAGEPLEFG